MPEQIVQSLKLKSYFSGTVEAAMELARKELGEDALLVNVRPSTPETRHLGTYEVVFGLQPTVEDALADRRPEVPSFRRVSLFTPPPLPPMPAPAPHVDRLAEDIAELRRQLDRMSNALSVQAPPAPAPFLSARISIPPPLTSAFLPPDPPARPPIEDALLDAELHPAIASAVSDGRTLEELFSTDATLGRPGSRRNVVMLVGPPGAGKTTALVKLAARYGLGMSRRTHLITCDVFRVAASDQLRTLASILGVGCDVVETPRALQQSLDEHQAKELILIDTPGIAHAEMDDAEELTRFAAGHPEIDTHLVLAASMKPADLARVVDSFQSFAPAKLLFTRLDETSRYGSLVNEAARVSLPISFLSGGQRIPDDLEPATRRRVADLVLQATHVKAKTMGASA